MKVLIAGTQHETHTFAEEKIDWLKFEEQEVLHGEDVIYRRVGSRTPIGGMIDGARKENMEIVGAFATRATPAGLVSKEALSIILGFIVEETQKHKDSLDGVLLELHGAMVSEDCDDVEGLILEKTRDVVGPEIPIVAVLDLHANISRAMIEQADALIGYDSYPHQDMYERGFEAATLIARIIRGELIPTMALCRPPLIPVPQAQYTDKDPMRSLLAMAHDLEKSGEAVSVTVAAGFPYSDVPFAGFSALVITNGDLERARYHAKEIAEEAWRRREDFLIENRDPKKAVADAITSNKYPVVLADVADNVGGGSPGDGTVIFEELLRQGAQGVVLVIADAEAARTAFKAGVGEMIKTAVGGKSDQMHGLPIEIHGRVHLLSDGVFYNRGSHSTGAKINMGPTAVVECNGITVVLTSLKVPPFDSNHLYSVGIVPADQKILVAKSAIAWKAAYGDVAKTIIDVDTPGLCTIHLDRFPFKKLRRPIFPLDLNDEPERPFRFEEAVNQAVL